MALVDQTAGQEKPKTAHAVLCEGALESIVFSRRGLYAAGVVGDNSHLSHDVIMLYSCAL